MSRKNVVTSERLNPLTAKQRMGLNTLAEAPVDAIDTSGSPELTEEFWKNSVQGKFYRPIKQQLTLRLDADVVAWFKAHANDGHGYQTQINRALREYVRERAGLIEGSKT